MRIAIVGCGITGLATAYYLEHAIQDVSITLFESSHRPGGKIETIIEDGFLVESGPDAVLPVVPQWNTLLKNLSLEQEKVHPVETTAYIYTGTRLLPLPLPLLRPKFSIASALSFLMTLPLTHRIALIRGVFRKFNLDEDCSVLELASRFFREPIAHDLLQPIFSGIYGDYSDNMSAEIVWPVWYRLARSGKRPLSLVSFQSSGQHTFSFHSFRNGMEHIVSSLRDNLSHTQILLNTPITSILRAHNTWKLIISTGDYENFDAVFIAVPPYLAGMLLNELDPELAHHCTTRRALPVVTITYAFEGEINLPGSGVLFAPGISSVLTSCTWVTNKWKGRAPENTTVIRCFTGRHFAQQALVNTSRDIASLVLDELKRFFPISHHPIKVWFRAWKHGMPMFEVHHMKWYRELLSLSSRHENLYLLGAGYKGLGVPSCVGQAYSAVKSFKTSLQGT